MKQFGDIEQNLSWTEAFFFHVRAQGDMQQIKSELNRLDRELNVRFRGTQQPKEREENELFGFLEGNEEPLREAQEKLRQMGWNRSPDL
jgi:hypothetical protein